MNRPTQGRLSISIHIHFNCIFGLPTELANDDDYDVIFCVLPSVSYRVNAWRKGKVWLTCIFPKSQYLCLVYISVIGTTRSNSTTSMAYSLEGPFIMICIYCRRHTKTSTIIGLCRSHYVVFLPYVEMILSKQPNRRLCYIVTQPSEIYSHWKFNKCMLHFIFGSWRTKAVIGSDDTIFNTGWFQVFKCIHVLQYRVATAALMSKWRYAAKGSRRKE